jgi:D-glycerate 3-kinase
LAVEAHPLFVMRGPPGTHDIALGGCVLDALGRPGTVRLPRFDKALDDGVDPAGWPAVEAPVDVVVFEGWCVGARPQPADALTAPVNALEAEEDKDGRWRSAVNAALAGAYQELFGRIDLLALLRPPAFDVVWGWRLEQEHQLRARTGGGMTDAGIARFVQHYERLSRWIDEEMRGRADVVVELDAGRRPLSVRFA